MDKKYGQQWKDPIDYDQYQYQIFIVDGVLMLRQLQSTSSLMETIESLEDQYLSGQLTKRLDAKRDQTRKKELQGIQELEAQL